MNDNTENRKPTIFYTTNKESEKSSRTEHHKRDNSPHKQRDTRQGDPKQKRDSNDRIEMFRPNAAKSVSDSKSTRQKFDDQPEFSDSPWNQKSKYKENRDKENKYKENKPKNANDNQVAVTDYDPHHQRKEETLVYSENSCKSVFKHRKEAIIKAFITQESAPQFKHLIEWLVSQRLGYDIVSNEQVTKITETPHHGGICLIIKKRQPLSVIDYLDENQNKTKNYVLAIDDVNNPHNLGGLVRTAAFYGINGLLLRQTNLLQSGAAMRVAEGGAESLTPLKTEDFVVSFDQFKQQGYQIIVLLPCQIASVKAMELHKMKVNNKTVFVIFQLINPKLIDCADQIVYLKGNENMAALNISVATGILLSQI